MTLSKLQGKHQIEIHEFSTGIQPEGNFNDWFSQSFTYNYMNVTIDPIPNIVEIAISNGLFQTVGGHPNQPAMIGRVLLGKTDRWSVVAVVTAGKDFKGKHFSAFRYFLAEGTENIHAIVAWSEERGRNNTLPIFNPFEIKSLGQSHKVTTETPESIPLNQDDIDWLNEPTASVTVAKFQSSLQDINYLAYVKSNLNKKSISWAYNVYSLKLPERFQVIYPVNDASRNAIHLSLSGNRQQPQALQASDVRLNPKILLKTLIGQSIPSDDLVIDLLEQMQERLTFDNGLNFARNPQDIEAKKRYWEEIFESLDATKGLSERLYIPQMVRLLTWQAIIFPEKLPNFLGWIHCGEAKQSEKIQATFLELQQELYPHLEEIKDNIILGILEVLMSLLPQEVGNKFIPSSGSVSNVVWLLETKDFLWAPFSQDTIKCILDKVLDSARLNVNSGQAWQSFITSLRGVNETLTQPSGWRNFYMGIREYAVNRQTDERYIYLAELFEQLGGGSERNFLSNVTDFLSGAGQLFFFVASIVLVAFFDIYFAADVAKGFHWGFSMVAPLVYLAIVGFTTKSFITAWIVGIPHIIFVRWRLCLPTNQGFAVALFLTVSMLAVWVSYKLMQSIKKKKDVNSDANALAAYLYSISCGSVTQRVFDNAAKSNYVRNMQVHGVSIARAQTIDDSLTRFVKIIWLNGLLSVTSLICLIVLLFVFGIHQGLHSVQKRSPFDVIISYNYNCPIPQPSWQSARKAIKKIDDDTTLSSDLPAPPPSPIPSPSPTDASITIDQKAIEKMFDEVQKAVDLRERDPTKSQQIILQAFKDVLPKPPVGYPELSYPIQEANQLTNFTQLELQKKV